MPHPTVDSDEDDGYCCKVCRFAWGLDVPSVHFDTLDELNREARSLSVDIFRCWVQLNTILKRFENSIQKRWLKKNFAQRAAILSEAWPGMSAGHRPDFEGSRGGCKKHRMGIDKKKVRDAHLWPYVNVEDLCQPLNLLVFLHSRGRHLPDKFAFADQLSAHNKKPSKNPGIDDFRMHFHRRTTPRSYGGLMPQRVDEEDDFASREIPEYKLGFHPCSGIQVLEIQSRILGFLARCCHTIMHDVSLENVVSLPLSVLVNPPTHNNSISITALAAEASYRLPQRIDLKRIKHIVSARRDDAEDHIWALREDPGYFAHEVKDWGDHCPATIKNKHGMPHECVGTPGFWDGAAYEMVVHAYSALILWDDAHAQLCDLVELDARFASTMHSGKRLHPAHEMTFSTFDCLITEMKHWPLADLAQGYCASPPLRAGFIRGSEKLPTLHQVKASARIKAPAEWRLFDLFKNLLSPEQHALHGLSNIVDEVQQTLDSVSERNLLTGWVTARFADLATIVEIKRQLDLFQPWAMDWRDEVSDESMDGSLDSRVVMTVEITALRQLFHCEGLDMEIADPARFPYPSDKRRTEATVTQMRHSEALLDDFWRRVDGHMRYITYYDGLHVLLAKHFTTPDHPLQRTPHWKPQSSPRLPDASPGSSRHGSGNDMNGLPRGLALAEMDPNARHARPGKAGLVESTPSKLKPKTRGATSAESKTCVPDPVLGICPGTGPVKFVVNKRAYRVFATLFHVPEDHYAPGEVSWTDFLYAMSYLGFSAEKLFGSSWQFTPPTGPDPAAPNPPIQRAASKPPIQFHEPHPHSKMHFWMAKRIGRRLHRTYGWHGAMFDWK